MYDRISAEFPKYWDKFCVQVKGQLMKQSKNGILTVTSAKLALDVCVGFWDDSRSEGKRWMDRLEKENPEKAKMVQDILIHDMRFQEVEIPKSSKGQVLKVGLPIGGAIAGLVISGLCGAPAILQAGITVGAGALSFPAANSVVNTMDANNKSAIIDSFMGQLDRYKVSIQSVLVTN